MPPPVRPSRSTLHKVERGDPGVGLGVYAGVLAGYGLVERLEHLVDARWDLAGLALEESRLPRRIRSPSGQEPSGSRMTLISPAANRDAPRSKP